MNSKRNKASGVNRLPSLFYQQLIKSEYDYKREIRRKLDQINHDNDEAVRRRLANNYVFAHEHLTKRRQWFQNDKSYRDSCRFIWNKEANEKTRTSHLHLPSIYPTNDDSIRFESKSNNNAMLIDAQIKQNFLRTQPVMLEILNAPHSSEVLKRKQHMELRKISAQRRFRQIQSNAIDDQRYQQLVYSLENVFN